MVIGIITFHFPYNCGAGLQCLALQAYLEKMGHKALVINYRPWYHQNLYTPLKHPLHFAREYAQLRGNAAGWAEGFLRAVGSWRHYPQRRALHMKYARFTSAYLHETKVFRTMDQLRAGAPACGLYICGSDQIWNPSLTGGRLDEAYFLTFAPEGAGRIAYAAGVNFDEYPPQEAELSQLLAGLDAAALRESKYAQTIRRCAPSLPLCEAVDPTLLLDGQDYAPYMAQGLLEREKYILTYALPDASRDAVYDAAKRLAAQKGCRVIDVYGNPTMEGDGIGDRRCCAPDEFLWYIRHAEYVVTNSFHGTAFSVIMQRPFSAVPHSKTGNRVCELLAKLGLEGRCAADAEQAVRAASAPVDYPAAYARLEALREASGGYLRGCIARYGNE